VIQEFGATEEYIATAARDEAGSGGGDQAGFGRPAKEPSWARPPRPRGPTRE